MNPAQKQFSLNRTASRKRLSLAVERSMAIRCFPALLLALLAWFTTAVLACGLANDPPSRAAGVIERKVGKDVPSFMHCALVFLAALAVRSQAAPPAAPQGIVTAN